MSTEQAKDLKPYIAKNGFVFPAYRRDDGSYAVPGGERTRNKEALDRLAVELMRSCGK